MFRITVDFLNNMVAVETEYEQIVERMELNKASIREFLPIKELYYATESFTFDFDLSTIATNRCFCLSDTADYVRRITPIHIYQAPGLSRKRSMFLSAIGVSEDIGAKARMFDSLYEELRVENNVATIS